MKILKIFTHIFLVLSILLGLHKNSYADDTENKLDEYIDIKMNNTTLTIRRGYLSHLYRDNSEFHFKNVKSISFNFWMPNQNYVENYQDIRRFGIPGLDKSDDTYIVIIMQLTPSEYDETKYLDVTRRLDNILKIFHVKFVEYGSGLLELRDEIEGPGAEIGFILKEDNKYKVLITCTPDTIIMPSPACKMMGQSINHGISFMILYPRNKLPETEKIIESTFNIVGLH